MEYGLHNLYLHHSYFPSVLTKLSCNAHTNITGGNGAGKTTLLSLIPIFYGVEPGKMVSKAGDKRSFVGHYLPSPKSMIVFEYSRMGKMCCAVLYRNQQSLEYRFVDGAAEDVLFSDESLEQLNKCPDANQWLMHFIGHQTDVSKQIKTTKDYRAVIQNNKRVLRQKRQRGDSLPSTAGNFSLCDPVYEMKHVEAITSVLMKSDKLLAKFKTMIIDAFLADQIEVNASPYHKQDGEYIDNLRSLIELEKNNEEFEQAISKRTEIDRLWSRLLHFRQLVSERLVSISNNITDTQSNIDKKESEHKAQLHVYAEQIEALSSDFHSAKGELSSLSEQIQRIYDKKNEWESKRDIHNKISEVETRSTLRSEVNDAETHYKHLLECAKSENAEHEANVSNVRLKASQHREKLNAEIQRLSLQVSHIERETAQIIDGLKEKFKAQADACKEKRTPGELDLHTALNELKFKKNNIGSRTAEEVTRLESIQHQIDELDDKIYESAPHLEALVSRIESLYKQKGARIDARKALTHRYDSLLKKRESLQRKIEPDENSLRSYLNEQYQGWEHTLGKVMRPELLDRKNLKPSIDDNTATLFGLSLDLEAIELTDEAQSVNVMRQLEAELTKDIASIVDQLDEVEKAIKKLDTDIQTSITEKRQCEHRIDELKATQKSFKLNLKQERAAIDSEKEKQREAIHRDLESAKKQLDDYKAKTTELLKEISEQSFSVCMECKVSQSEKTESLSELIKHNRALIKTSTNNEKRRVLELNDAFSKVMEEKGISSSVANKAKELFHDAKHRLEMAESYVDEVTDYRRWMDNVWSQLQTLEVKEGELSTLAAQSEAELQSVKAERLTYNKTSSLELDVLRKELDEMEATKRALSGVKQSLYSDDVNIPHDHPVAEALSEDIPVNILMSQASETVSTIKQTINSIRSAVRKVESILLNSDKNNKVNDHWLSIKDKITKEGVSDTSDLYCLECAKGIDVLINSVIPDVKRLTVEQIRSVGEGYIRFYQTLETLNSKVKSVSSVLAKEINTKNNFPDIGSVTVELVSKVQEYAIWTELGAFSQQWERWVESDRNALPDAVFLSAFQRAIDGMRAGGIEGVSAARSASTIEPLIDIKISLVENNRLVVVRNDQDLEEASSEGLSKLAIIIVFCGATRYLCPDPNVRIHWPLDELGKISNENVSLLFEFMDSHNINLFCAQPNPNEVLRKFFPIKCEVIRGQGIRRYRPATSNNEPNPLLNEKAAQEALS